MFKLYFLRISKFRGEFLSPLGASLNGIRGSALSYFETKVLVLCIHTEGILNILYPKLGKPPKHIRSEVNKLLRHIRSWQGEDSVRNRSLSAIGNMKEPRAMDKLIKLKEKGVINAKQLEAWIELRNKFAHANSNIGDQWFKETYKKYEIVVEMLYRIILYASDYKGNYTVYSEGNKPICKFNLY